MITLIPSASWNGLRPSPVSDGFTFAGLCRARRIQLAWQISRIRRNALRHPLPRGTNDATLCARSRLKRKLGMASAPTRDRIHFLFLNVGHFLDHLLTLVFATVAALALTREWGLSYSALIPYATPGFIAFGVFALPAGWLADKWSREGMMAVFFVGIGLASIATGVARTPFEVGLGLFVIGVFAAIYHPVGLALLVERASKTGTGMAIGINGVWGNLGVASAALITGFFIVNGGWRFAFLVPGFVSVLIGLSYIWLFCADMRPAHASTRNKSNADSAPLTPDLRSLLIKLSAIIFFTTAVSGIVFQSTTFALPKVFDERLTGIAGSAPLIGWLAFLVFAVA